MKKGTHSKSNLLLLELTINLLFFCIFLTLCVQFFVRSYEYRISSQNLTFASNEIANVVEILDATEGKLGKITEYYPDSQISDDGSSLTVYYDKAKETTSDSDDYAFRLDITTEGSDNNLLFNVSFFENKGETFDCIYELSKFIHVRKEADHE